MAQSGFAFFFLAVLVGCTVSLVAWTRLHWQKILVAVRGDMPDTRMLEYRAAQRRPIDIPYVAQRMLSEHGYRAECSTDRRPAWTRLAGRPTSQQLAFGF